MWSNFESHWQSYAKTFKKPVGDFKIVTQEEQNDISQIVESYLQTKAKKVVEKLMMAQKRKPPCMITN